MKLKGLILSSVLLAAILCGCSVSTDYDETALDKKVAVNSQANAVVQKVEDVLMNSEYEMSDSVRNMLDEDFQVTESVEFVQHSNGREVNVYKSKELPSLYLLYDGEWIELIKPAMKEPVSCKNIYTALRDGALIPVDYNVGSGDTDAIICENEEFSLMSFEGGSMFSVIYNDVDVHSEDMPVKAVVYCTDGKAVRVEFIYVCLNGGEKMSDNNVAEASALLTSLGLGEESTVIAGEFADSVDKASYSRSDGALTISSYKNAARDGNIVYNVFTVDM